jgi:hypothetical protein
MQQDLTAPKKVRERPKTRRETDGRQTSACKRRYDCAGVLEVVACYQLGDATTSNEAEPSTTRQELTACSRPGFINRCSNRGPKRDGITRAETYPALSQRLQLSVHFAIYRYRSTFSRCTHAFKCKLRMSSEFVDTTMVLDWLHQKVSDTRPTDAHQPLNIASTRASISSSMNSPRSAPAPSRPQPKIALPRPNNVRLRL